MSKIIERGSYERLYDGIAKCKRCKTVFEYEDEEVESQYNGTVGGVSVNNGVGWGTSRPVYRDVVVCPCCRTYTPVYSRRYKKNGKIAIIITVIFAIISILFMAHMLRPKCYSCGSTNISKADFCNEEYGRHDEGECTPWECNDCGETWCE